MLIHFVIATRHQKLETRLKRYLDVPDVRVTAIQDGPTAWQSVVISCGDIIVIDEAIVPKPVESGLTILNNLPENPTTVVLHDDDSPEEQAQLVTAGADVVLFAGLSTKSVVSAIETTVESRRQMLTKDRFEKLGKSKPVIADFVSDSVIMQLFMEEVKPVVPSDTTLLILGETGVGKEHLAKAIHSESTRSAGPFVTVNVAALPETLLESELFGHAQGAFTGADRARRGAFELAHRGTVFLDEIGEMPLHLQSKLLHVLQDYEIHPVGSESSVWVDVRIMAATNRDLESEVSTGNFRKDLYYRLSVVTLTLPPLRERPEDIPSLATRFLELNCQKRGSEIEGFEENTLEALVNYEWPGNIRELMNVIERAVLLSKNDSISLNDLPQIFHRGIASDLSLPDFAHPHESWKKMTLHQVREKVLEQTDKSYLTMLLKEADGRVGDVARRAGLHPRGLYDIMKRIGLRKEDFKPKTSPKSLPLEHK